MQLNYHKKFVKGFLKLAASDQNRVKEAVELFRSDPFDPRLQNHKLHGKQRGMHSFSAGHDLRILYEEQGGHAIVLLVKIGLHEQVHR